MKIFDKEETYIISPENRVYEYLLFSQYIFNQKKVHFCSDLNSIDIANNQIIVDLKNIHKFNEHKFQNYSLKIVIILWNSYQDYLKNKDQLIDLKKKFTNLILLSPSNFSFERNIFFPLDNLNFNSENNLVEITGVKYLKKIKYKFPSVFSFYNFFRYLPRSSKYLKEKIVFVGLGDNFDISYQLKYLIQSNITSDEMKIWSKYILNNFHPHNNIFTDNSILEIKNSNMRLDEKYYGINLIIRNSFINYLKNFNAFVHKTNSRDAFELLKTNFYKEITHLDLGSQCGNGIFNVRNILLNRFYKNKNIRFNFFDNKVSYNNQNFNDRLGKIELFLNKIYEFKNFNCSAKELKKQLEKLSKFL